LFAGEASRRTHTSNKWDGTLHFGGGVSLGFAQPFMAANANGLGANDVFVVSLNYFYVWNIFLPGKSCRMLVATVQGKQTVTVNIKTLKFKHNKYLWQNGKSPTTHIEWS